jgi:diphthine-ammonia ligase
MTDELDSYLYQSVGTSLVTLIAQAMRLPLYRRTITGKPVHLESTYGSRTKDRSTQAEDTPRKNDGIEGDETEDLDVLLHQVKVRSS